jgi:hypothetical protein
MVETTFDIHFSADGNADAHVASNVSGDAERQALLVSFAHYCARTLLSSEPGQASAIVDYLASMESASEVAQAPGLDGRDAGAGKTARVTARFLNGRSGPRLFFRMSKTDLHGLDSVRAVASALADEGAADRRYVQSLVNTAAFVGWLCAQGELRSGSELDSSLAAADVAWKVAHGPDGDWTQRLDAHCPECGNARDFEHRLWPSEQAEIRGCAQCRAGVWLRLRRRPRVLPHDTWAAMETTRAELQEQLAGETKRGAEPLLEELRQVFVENRWPFAEVRGAPILLSDLSGPKGSWKFYAHAVEALDLVLLYSVCPLTVPRDRRDEVARFLTLANYGLAAGNFELDFDDGEVRYKTALQVQQSGLDRAAMKRVVRANGVAMEMYLPGIGAVIDGTPATTAFADPS